MNNKIKTPFRSLNAVYRRMPVANQDIICFAKRLANYAKNINEKESDEHAKNKIAKLVYDTFYNDKSKINTRGRIDLAIYDEQNPIVIFEYKSPKSYAHLASSRINKLWQRKKRK